MSTDSAAQLMEARSGVLSDAHPPIMAKEWGLLDRIVAGPLLMLFLQGTLFLGGLFVILRRLLSERAAAWTAIGILLFPPVLTPMAVIWKDSQMAAYLVAGIAAMLHPRLRIRLVGLGLLVVACALRHNAFAAVAPLVFFVFEWKSGIRWWKRLALLFAAMILSVALAFGVTRILSVTHIRLTPAFNDIVSVLALTEPRSDEDLRHVLRGVPLAVDHDIQARARLLYLLPGVWRVTVGDDRLLDYPVTEEQWDALHRAWKELVLDDPRAYLEAHWYRFQALIGISDEPPRAAVWNLFLEVPDEQRANTSHDASWSWIQQTIGNGLYWLADETPLFRPYVYALIALLLLVLACRDRLTLALYASGLLYMASFFPVGAEPDYRYSHWMITCVVVASVILFIQRRRTRS